MWKWTIGLLCCAVALVGPVVLAQEADEDAIKAAREKYDALRKQADALRREMGKFRGKYEKDADVVAARKQADAAGKTVEEKMAASSAIADAKAAAAAARKQLAEEINAAMAADAEAGAVLKKHEDVTKRLAALREQINTLTAEQRKLQGELSTHQRRISRNRDVAKDARAAVAAAEKAHADAVKSDAGVQEALKAQSAARANYTEVRDRKVAADPEYAELAAKMKALEDEMKALRDKMRPPRGPRKARKAKKTE